MLLFSLIELLEQKKTAQPQQQGPKDDVLDHRKTQVATIEPKIRDRSLGRLRTRLRRKEGRTGGRV